MTVPSRERPFTWEAAPSRRSHSGRTLRPGIGQPALRTYILQTAVKREKGRVRGSASYSSIRSRSEKLWILEEATWPAPSPRRRRGLAFDVRSSRT